MLERESPMVKVVYFNILCPVIEARNCLYS